MVRTTMKTQQKEHGGEEATEEVVPEALAGASRENHRHRVSRDEAALASPVSAGRQNQLSSLLPGASGQAMSSGSSSAAEQAWTSSSTSGAGVDVRGVLFA